MRFKIRYNQAFPGNALVMLAMIEAYATWDDDRCWRMPGIYHPKRLYLIKLLFRGTNNVTARTDVLYFLDLFFDQQQFAFQKRLE